MRSIEYELTEEEAEIAGARVAWRMWLAGGLRRHATPLVVFVAAIAAIAGAGLGGAISRRAAEISLILAAAMFMALQLWTRRGMARARRRGAEIAGALCGPVRLTLDEAGFAQEGAHPARFAFAQGLEVEAVGDLNYVWPRKGAPLVWPRRAHPSAAEADDFLDFARSQANAARRDGPDRDSL